MLLAQTKHNKETCHGFFFFSSEAVVPVKDRNSSKESNMPKKSFFLVGVSPGLFIAVPDLPKVVRSANQ